MTKCNAHATMFDNNIIMGYDMCFRNSVGQIMLSKSSFLISTATVLEDEFIVLLESIKTAISYRVHILLFETDCKSLVDTLTSSIVSIDEFDNLVFQCRSLLSSNPNYVMLYLLKEYMTCHMCDDIAN